jgi:hypothetical protein
MYNHDCFEITFDNYEKIIADRDHLWRIKNDDKKKAKRIVNTAQIYELNEYLKDDFLSLKQKLVHHSCACVHPDEG